jgi:hypothetical protein
MISTKMFARQELDEFYSKMLNSFIQAFFVILIFSFLSCSSKENVVKKFQDGVYKGQIDKKGRKHGEGIIIWNDGSSYEGSFKKDLRHGTGFFTWKNGESYKGDYLNDIRTGSGIYRWTDGSFYEGSFLRGKRHGFGRFQTSNGIIYEGEWHEDENREIKNISHKNRARALKIVKDEKEETALSKELVPSTNNLSGSFSKQPTEKNIVRSVNIEEPFKKEMVFEDNQLSSISENKNFETIQSPNSIIEVSSDKSSVEEESTNDGFIITSVKQTAETDNTILSEGDQPNQYVEGTNTWTGTVSEAEEQFTTNTVNGIDIVKDVNSQVPFTGKMQILNKNGSILGEVNLLDGKLHGEEIILDDTGIIVERYLWNKGVELK